MTSMPVTLRERAAFLIAAGTIMTRYYEEYEDIPAHTGDLIQHLMASGISAERAEEIVNSLAFANNFNWLVPEEQQF